MNEDERSRAHEHQPPGGLVEVVSRWERAGGHWRVSSSNDQWISLDLLSCDGGEVMSTVRGRRTSVLRSFLAGRESNAD